MIDNQEIEPWITLMIVVTMKLVKESWETLKRVNQWDCDQYLTDAEINQSNTKSSRCY